MTVVKCEMCGENFDTADYNKTHGIYTKVFHSHICGTKKDIVYLCVYCNMEIEDLIGSR